MVESTIGIIKPSAIVDGHTNAIFAYLTIWSILIVVLHLVKDNSIRNFRALIGATDPAQADSKSLRYRNKKGIE